MGLGMVGVVAAAAWGSVAWRGECGMEGSEVRDIGKEESIIGNRDGDDTGKEDSDALVGQSVERNQRTTRGE